MAVCVKTFRRSQVAGASIAMWFSCVRELALRSWRSSRGASWPPPTLAAGYRWVEPTHGVPLYLGTAVAAAAVLFLPTRLRAVPSLVAWGFAASSAASATAAVVGMFAVDPGPSVVPWYLLHELPASALGVTLIITATGGSPARRVEPAEPSRSWPYVVTTALRCLACLLLLLCVLLHTLMPMSFLSGKLGGFPAYVARALVPTMLWVSSLVQLLLGVGWRAGGVVKGANLVVVGAVWTALASDLAWEQLSFVVVLATCALVALAASHSTVARGAAGAEGRPRSCTCDPASPPVS